MDPALDQRRSRNRHMQHQVSLPSLLLPRDDSREEDGDRIQTIPSSLRVRERRRLREIHGIVSDLATHAAAEKMRVRYGRKFNHKKWIYLAQLVAFASKEQYRFQRSIDRVFLNSLISFSSERSSVSNFLFSF